MAAHPLTGHSHATLDERAARLKPKLVELPVLVVTTIRQPPDSAGTVDRWQTRDRVDTVAELDAISAAAEAGTAFVIVLLDAIAGLDGFGVAEADETRPELDGATIMMLTSRDSTGTPFAASGIAESYQTNRQRCDEAICAAGGDQDGGARSSTGHRGRTGYPTPEIGR